MANETAKDPIQILKKIAMDAVDNSMPLAVMYGTVTSVDPLKINVEQKLELDGSFFELTNAVKDHYVDISVSHVTENTNIDHTHKVQGSSGGADSPAHTHDVDIVSKENEPTTGHLHAYKGRKKILVHNALQVGEEVVMLRFKRGQKFLVIDRVTDCNASGQWI